MTVSPGMPPADPARPRRDEKRQVGLRHLMVLSAVVALVFAAIAQAYRTGEDADILLAVLSTGAAIAAFGVFMNQRMTRLSGLGWFLVGVGPVGASAALVGASSEWDVYYIVVALAYEIPVVIGVIAHLVARRRSAQQEATLWVLALAADRARPLGTAVAALAAQSTGVDRARGMNLAEALDSGLALPDALEFVTGSAPGSARLLARVGHDSGRLAEALHDAAASRSARPPGWQDFGAQVGYLCVVALVLQFIAGFILYFSTPHTEAIFNDFGIPLPPITIGVIRASQFLVRGFALPIFALVEGLVLVYIPFAFAGYNNLHVPIVDRLFLRRHSVLVLRSLGLVVDGGRPIGLGLKILARWYPTDWVRERLVGVALAAEGGHDWIDALRRFGLIARSDAALLESARRVGNLPWALRELAEGSARRLGHRLQVTGQVLTTLALLALGAFVGLFSVAYFYPLVALIERLAS